jgi:hypothetical protein
VPPGTKVRHEPESPAKIGALREFVAEPARGAAPAAARRRFRSGGAPTTDRTRSTFVFGNVFLHLHAGAHAPLEPALDHDDGAGHRARRPRS